MADSNITVEISGIEELIDQKISEVDTGLSEDDVISIVDEHSVGSDKDVDEALKKIERSRRAVELPGRKVGPESPSGTYHAATMWGIHFKVKGDKGDVGGGAGGVAHIRDSKVDAMESGSFDAVLGRYDGDDEFDEVARKKISVDEGVNTVTLDFVIPESGEYLLTRDGDFPLMRGDFRGWDDHMNSGVQMIGGSKPGDWEKPNGYWYYYFDLEIASSVDYHLED